MNESAAGTDNRKQVLKRLAVERVQSMAPELWALSDRIFHNPELGFAEHRASAWLTEFLASKGFTVERGVAGMETAFVASASGASDGPRIAFLAEYDALPDIGHGCGHNVIGVAACGAAVAVADALKDTAGTALVFGCPAEEGAVLGAGGKVELIRHGCFEGVDAAMMIHPASRYVVSSKSSARAALELAFRGAAAQDACLMTFNAINSLRQHLRHGVKIHGIVAGEETGRSAIRAYVRAPTTGALWEYEERVKECARGAALACDCEVEFQYTSPTYEELITNSEIAAAFSENLRLLGIQVEEYVDAGTGSTDMGNVSHVVPSLHAYVATCPRGVPGHTREFGRATLTQAAHDAMLVGVQAMAMTAIDLLEEPGLLARAKSEFRGLSRR